MREAHFFPHAGAHPLCYSVAYYLKDNGAYRSLTDFLTVEELRQMLGHGYLLQPEDDSQDVFRAAIDRLWAAGDDSKLAASHPAIGGTDVSAGKIADAGRRGRRSPRNRFWRFISIRTWTRTRSTWRGWWPVRTRCPIRKAV